MISSSFRRRFFPVGKTFFEWSVLGVLILFTLVAVAGYGVFALHPNLIPDSDAARDFFGLSFSLFARVHIALSALVLAIPLVTRTGFAWVPAFLAVFFLSFLSEFVGTGYGFPFGEYEYTSLLGFKLGGRVPALIPLSWFLMALPAWRISLRAFPGPKQFWARTLLGAYLLTAWDLALDPAMSFLTPYWVWADPGPFYGMPVVNLAGWMGTGIVLMGMMEVLGGGRWIGKVPVAWLAAYYGVVLLMPLGMALVAGLWWAVLATLAALLSAYGAVLIIRSRLASSPRPALASEGVAG